MGAQEWSVLEDMSVSQLSGMLQKRGVRCVWCLEKEDFLAKSSYDHPCATRGRARPSGSAPGPPPRTACRHPRRRESMVCRAARGPAWATAESRSGKMTKKRVVIREKYAAFCIPRRPDLRSACIRHPAVGRAQVASSSVLTAFQYLGEHARSCRSNTPRGGAGPSGGPSDHRPLLA